MSKETDFLIFFYFLFRDGIVSVVTADDQMKKLKLRCTDKRHNLLFICRLEGAIEKDVLAGNDPFENVGTRRSKQERAQMITTPSG